MVKEFLTSSFAASNLLVIYTSRLVDSSILALSEHYFTLKDEKISED